MKTRSLFFALQLLIIYSCKEEEEVKFNSPYIVSTVAGSTQGFADGVSSAAKFSYPNSVAVDVNGNVYVADAGNHRIRKITPDGTVFTFAGGEQGDADGKGTAARFNTLTDITFDSQGDLYVTDAYTIRKIKPDGTVTTFAGKGPYSSFSDGTLANARFSGPAGIVINKKNGNIYISDTGNHRVRVITPDGMVSTLAGATPSSTYTPVDGTGASALFSFPGKLALDGDGNILMADLGMGIRKISPEGKVTTISGKGSGFRDGDISSALFNAARGIAVNNSGEVFIAEGPQGASSSSGQPVEINARIRMINADEKVQTIAGGASGLKDGKGNEAQLFAPNGISVAPDGTIYVADEMNHVIRKITLK